MPTFPQSPQQPPKGLSFQKILIILILAGIGWFVLKNIFSYLNYQKAEKAYQESNCEKAISYDEQFLNASPIDLNDSIARSQARQSECQQFLSASQKRKSGASAIALVEFINLNTRYPYSPVNQSVRREIANLFSSEQITTLAQPSVCDKIEPLKPLLPKPSTNLPSLYQNCGNSYHKAQQYEKATEMYEKFLANYPNHLQTETVKQSLAQTIIADARQQGAGQISPPPISGYTADGSTVVAIRNDSPTTIRLVFTGPETQLQEIAPCKNCQKYTTPPQSCPDKGPKSQYVLKPGTYEIVVKSIDSSGIKPYIGKWTLAKGSKYGNCFYLVSQPIAQ